jgi:hypothetical protein
MSKFDFGIGAIVRVVDKDGYFWNFQGLVVSTKIIKEDTTICVCFDNATIPRWRCDPDNDATVISFKPEQLEKCADWDAEVKAKRLFGDRMWHHIYVCPDPLDPKKPCQVDNCLELQQIRIMVNCWGTVYDADCCLAHAEQYHGLCMDGFPWRKEDKEPAVKSG